MVEVFKTDVKNSDQAKKLLEMIHTNFSDYKASFDLEDCDNILRVVNSGGEVASEALIIFLKASGCCAEIL